MCATVEWETKNNLPTVNLRGPTVEVLGYGGGSGEEEPPADNERNRGQQGSMNYDPSGALRVLGNGEITPEENRVLTDEERRLLNEAERQRL